MTGDRTWLNGQFLLFGDLYHRIGQIWRPISGDGPEARALRNRRRTLLKEALTEMDPEVFRAIFLALRETLLEPNGEEKLLVEELVSFRRSHTLQGAALEICCHPNTAGNWHRRFLSKVRKNLNNVHSVT